MNSLKFIKNEKSFKMSFSTICVFVLIFCAFANASFRISSSGMTSIFRLASPFFAIYVLLKYNFVFKEYVIAFLMLCLYSIIMSLLFFSTIVLESYIFGIYLFILFILIKYLKIKTDKQFVRVFFSFLNIVFIVTVVLCLIELITGIKLPNIKNSPAIRAYFDNENELCAALACMSIVFFYYMLFSKKYIYLVNILLIAFIVYFDDAKLSLLGMVFGFFIITAFYLIRKKTMQKQLSLFFISLVTLSVFVIFISRYINILGFNLYDIIVTPIERIIFSKPYMELDSVGYRTNAIIYGLNALKDTIFMGVGFGHANTVLDVSFMGANRSMHNIIVQFLVEFGVVALIVYLLIIKRLINNFKKYDNSYNVLKFAFALSFIILSSQSSQGILSNYYVWTITLFVFLIPLETKSKKITENQKYCSCCNKLLKTEGYYA